MRSGRCPATCWTCRRGCIGDSRVAKCPCTILGGRASWRATAQSSSDGASPSRNHAKPFRAPGPDRRRPGLAGRQPPLCGRRSRLQRVQLCRALRSYVESFSSGRTAIPHRPAGIFAVSGSPIPRSIDLLRLAHHEPPEYRRAAELDPRANERRQETTKMTEPSTKGSSTRVSRIIKAPRKVVYQAFLDQSAVASSLPPETMTGRVHIFEPRERVWSGTVHEIASLPTRH
jgi:hypothetical protein